VQKRWIWTIAGGLVVLGVLGAVLAAPALARRALATRARARGVVLFVEQVEVGLGRLGLHRVRLTLEGVPSFEVRLDQVDLGVSLWGLGLEQVDVRGGHIAGSGTREEIVERLSAWRERHRSKGRADPNKPTKGSIRITVGGADARFELGEGEELKVSRLAFEDLLTGPARLGADRVTLSRPGSSVDAAGFEAELASGAAGIALASARIAEMRVSLHLGEGTHAPADSPSTPPADDAGLAGSLPLHPDRVPRIRSTLALVRRLAREKLPAEVTVERLWLGVESDSEQLSVGPSRLSIARTDTAMDWSLVPLEKGGGTPLELGGRVPLGDAEPVTIRLRGGPVTFSQLGVKDGDFGLAGVAGSSLEGQADVKLEPDGAGFAASGSLGLESLALRVDRLAKETILVPRLSVRGTLRGASDGSSFALEGAELSIGQARFDGRLQLERHGESVLLDAGLRAPLVSCQALLDSAPRALLGAVADMQWSGTFSLDAAVRADSSALAKMAVLWKFDNGCRITAVPAELDPERFRAPFPLEVLGPGGVPQTLEFGPGSPQFVPIDDISPFVEAALLVTEDGRFHRHHGFDDRAIESAIRDNVRAGRFVRGASTLSMQLAKNLYLSRTKTLSRKLQEAALTMLLEQNFSKREILELYLNVVEFGPGIYGIGPAAAYYFGKPARDLSPAQAFFIASVLPSPTVRHFDEQGNLSASRLRHVHSLLRISHERGRLSADELAAALTEVPHFGRGESQPSEETPVP